MRRRGDEGVALLLVLLFIVLLTVIVVEFMYESRVEASLTANHMGSLEARVAARSAVAAGMSLLVLDQQETLQEQMDAYDSLMDLWAEGVPYQELNNGFMQCTVSDEYGKLNLNALVGMSEPQVPEAGNAAPEQVSDMTISVNEQLAEVLRLLFLARGAVEDPVDAILDWMDSDNQPRPNGAESDYYGSLEVPYGCKNGPFDSVEELLLVRGITPELYFGDPNLGQLPLTELLTVHGHRTGRVNLNTAPIEVLTAIGEMMGQSALGEIIAQERETAPFRSRQELEARGIVMPNQEGSNIRRPFVVRSNTFRIRGDGLAGESMARIEAYVVRSGTPGLDGGFRILDWRELQ